MSIWTSKTKVIEATPMISKVEYQHLLSWPVEITDEDWVHLTRIHFADDWQRELSDDEISLRFMRVSGECICPLCGLTYYTHPKEVRVQDFSGNSTLYRLCNGWLGHT